MTYLDLVNNVLRRLRETEVNSVQDNAYSKLIGDLVNDAKNLVDSSWDWSMERKPIIQLITDNDRSVVLLGSGESPKIQSMTVGWEGGNLYGGTGNYFVEYIDQVTMEKYERTIGSINSPEPKGMPYYYTIDGINSNRDTEILLYPVPDQNYYLYTQIFTSQADLVLDGDILDVPTMPVLHLAVAFASRERGETGGTSTQEYFSIANKYLSDAIAMDAGKHPEKTIFYTP